MNVKKGDLAIVIRAAPPSDAAGKIVKVINWVGTAVFSGKRYNNLWEIQFQSPTKMVSSAVLPAGELAVATDSQLRPVSGLPDAQDTDVEKPIEEMA